LFAHSRRIENADNGQKGIEMAKSRCHRGWSFLALRTARMTIDADGGQSHLGGYVSAEAFRG